MTTLIKHEVRNITKATYNNVKVKIFDVYKINTKLKTEKLEGRYTAPARTTNSNLLDVFFFTEFGLARVYN